MELSIREIFNNTTIKVRGKQYPVKFTVSSEVFLEDNGISVFTLSKKMLEQPKKTSLFLAYAGLPRKDFREKMSFERFLSILSTNEAEKITKQVDVLSQAYFKCILGEIHKGEEKQNAPANNVKKNWFKSFCKWPLKLVGRFRK